MLVLILGIIGELFVPTLPLNIPRRGFGVYSWMALLQSQVQDSAMLSEQWLTRSLLNQELRFEVANDLNKLMNLDELEKRLSDKQVRFVV